MMFYSKTGGQQFPWKELARKQGQCSVNWKTTLRQPAGEERIKKTSDPNTKRDVKQIKNELKSGWNTTRRRGY